MDKLFHKRDDLILVRTAADDRHAERLNPELAGRPDLLGGRKSMTVYDGMTGIMENALLEGL